MNEIEPARHEIQIAVALNIRSVNPIEEISRPGQKTRGFGRRSTCPDSARSLIENRGQAGLVGSQSASYLSGKQLVHDYRDSHAAKVARDISVSR